MTQTSSAAIADSTSAPQRYIQTRRIKFAFGDPAPMRKYYFDNDIAMSHIIALLSAAFPEGEEGFVRSVRRFSDRITDPILKKQVTGFIGQEMTHGREHRNLNVKLQEMGYPVDKVDQRMRRIAKWEERLSPMIFLAATAAAEHTTAILAERVLTSRKIQAIASDPEVRALLNWHALEELEHKAVAFDVYRAVGGTERMRVAVAALMTVLALAQLVPGLIESVLRDPDGRNPVKLVPSLLRLPRSPLIKGMGRSFLRYFRPGFHPDDHDTDALLDRWRAELFGKDGSLVDHLK